MRAYTTALTCRLIPLMLALFCLSACQLMPSTRQSDAPPVSEVQRDASKTVAHFLKLADESASPQRERYQLQAVNQLLQARIYDGAKQLLTHVNTRNIPKDASNLESLIHARLAMHAGDPQAALRFLRALSHTQTHDMKIEVLQLQAQAYARSGNVLASLRQRASLTTLLDTPTQREDNNKRLWETLQTLNLDTLRTYQRATGPGYLKGWINLSMLSKRTADNPEQRLQALRQWREHYPAHPANALLPTQLTTNPAITAHHVALLLPLTGKYRAISQAVRDGFMVAYRADSKKRRVVNRISIFDTKSGKDAVAAYQAARNKHVDFIIGPLTKQGVDNLKAYGSLDTPTLTLNYSTAYYRSVPHLFEFGLAPENEARQAADRAWQDGFSHALILAQRTDWGQRTADAFSRRWQALGGDLVAQKTFSNRSDLAQIVQQALHVSQSHARAATLKQLIGRSPQFEARRRKDIDMIFLASLPVEARQIRPLLSFYYAHDLPVYATASVYGGTTSVHKDSDMNGVVFCDMPWVLSPSTEQQRLKKTIGQLWPDSAQRFTRLYALGIDAYRLIPQLSQWQSFPQFAFNGATGQLQLNAEGRLVRQLICAQFTKGMPKVIGAANG